MSNNTSDINRTDAPVLISQQYSLICRFLWSLNLVISAYYDNIEDVSNLYYLLNEIRVTMLILYELRSH